MKHAWFVWVLVAGCASEANTLLDAEPNSSVDAGADVLVDALAEASAHHTESLVVAIDPDSQAGSIKDVFGVNKRPIAYNAKDTSVEYNVAAAYKAFGVTSARMHDDVVELCEIYKDAKIENYDSGAPVTTTSCNATNHNGPPHLKWTVRDASKVNDPANYRFEEVDRSISALLEAGATPYLRLGHKYDGPNDTGDPASWAKVAINIYKHFIGKFGPSAVKFAPEFVEVFNEPDGFFWVGTKTDFATLFNNTADGVRAAASAAGLTVKVGGPGFTTNYLKTVKNPKSIANGFVEAVTAGRLDFFSTHWYDQCDKATLANAETYFKSVRTSIDAQGLSSKPLHISEWNIGLGQDCGEEGYKSAQVGSYASGVLTLMQDAQHNMGSAHFFSGVTPMSLFAIEPESAGKVFVRPMAWAFWAHHKLAKGTRMTLNVCKDATCTSGTVAAAPVLALAGSAGDKKYIVLTNDTEASTALTLRLTKRTSGTFIVQVPPTSVQSMPASKTGGSAYTLSDSDAAALINSVPRTQMAGASTPSGLEINLTMAARSIMLVQLP